VAVGDREIVYSGPGFITERIGRRKYRISANSFFQTNTVQAERLYDTVRRMAALRPDDVVFDLYSGTGTIALHVADDAAAVVGIEAVASAVEDARKNAADNGVNNCTFMLGDLKDRMVGETGWLGDVAVPDVILVDPPRAGIHPKVVEKILEMRPRRIVYVSCNPATQARDAKLLCDGGAYGIDEAQPVDMFPHTTHVENVLRFSAAGSA
jgi:23S rRNA (uracil1939-C5)-methyltransferase